MRRHILIVSPNSMKEHTQVSRLWIDPAKAKPYSVTLPTTWLWLLVVKLMRCSSQSSWWRARPSSPRNSPNILPLRHRPDRPCRPLIVLSDVVEKDLSADMLAEFLEDNLKAYQANGSSIEVRHERQCIGPRATNNLRHSRSYSCCFLNGSSVEVRHKVQYIGPRATNNLEILYLTAVFFFLQ